MKSIRHLCLAALAAASGPAAHAEVYDGVHPLTTTGNSVEVWRDAVATSHRPDAYAEAATAHVHASLSTADRASVRADAVAKAHDPLQSLDRRAFYRDQIPSAYSKPHVSFGASATR